MVSSSDKDKKDKEEKEDALKVCLFVLSVCFVDYRELNNQKSLSVRKCIHLISFFQTNVIPSKEKITKGTEEAKNVIFYCFIISINLIIYLFYFIVNSQVNACYSR